MKKKDIKTLQDLKDYICDILDEFEIKHHNWSDGVSLSELLRGKTTKPIRLKKRA